MLTEQLKIFTSGCSIAALTLKPIIWEAVVKIMLHLAAIARSMALAISASVSASKNATVFNRPSKACSRYIRPSSWP